MGKGYNNNVCYIHPTPVYFRGNMLLLLKLKSPFLKEVLGDNSVKEKKEGLGGSPFIPNSDTERLYPPSFPTSFCAIK